MKLTNALCVFAVAAMACNTDKNSADSGNGGGPSGDTGSEGGSGSGGSGGEGSGGGEAGGETGEESLPPSGCDFTQSSFYLDFESATTVEPVALASFLAPELDGSVGIAITSQTDSSMDGFVAQLKEDVQDVCEPTSPLPTGAWSDPRFSFGPVNLPVVISDDPVELSDFLLTGVARSDCSGFDAITFDAQLDMRIVGPFAGSLLGTTDPDELCDQLGLFGVECVPCASDSIAYCMDVVIDDVVAERTAEMMVPVDPAALPDGC